MDVTFLRSSPARWLVGVALLLSMALASAFVLLDGVKNPTGADADVSPSPLSDAAAADQVLSSAQQIVAVARLRNPTGSYVLMACQGEDGPPYQGSAYINFDVPSITATPAFFRAIVTEMTAHGWTEGMRLNQYPGGRTLGREGMSALFYRNPDAPGRGVMRIYGECRNMTDHRDDAGSFVDITARLAD